MQKTVFGLFENKADVEELIAKLKDEGFNPKDISIVMRDSAQAQEISDDTGTSVAGGVVSGAATGAIIGGIAGLLAAVAIPGLGAILIGGPIAAALGLGGAAAVTTSGIATGAVAGGLLGALMGLGLSKNQAEHYESRVNEGAILLAVPTAGREGAYIEEVFDDFNASDVETVENDEADVTSERYAEGPRFAFAGTKGGRAKRKRVR